ncbi:hypothetical protein BC332_01341 [Capsicum chinense]|nr:hypothetical protein BC332_01341 [Capsicum chinense]
MEFEGVGGYYTWSSTHFPLLSQKKLAAGLLVLHPRVFSQPYYSVSSKIAYVCQGECIVGLISSEDSKEEVIKLQKKDALPVTMKAMSWWYNDGDSILKIIFLGEYDDEYTPGEYYGFFLTGAAGILNGFSNEFIAKSFHMMTKIEFQKLIEDLSISNPCIKINEGIKMPDPCNKDVKHKLVFNLDSAKPCAEVKNGGTLSAVTCSRIVLEGGALFGPIFTADSSVQLSYVTKGSGRVQIVGPFADEGGIVFFSVVTSSKQVYGELSGRKKSIWEAAPPSVLEASLNMTSDLTEFFKSKIAKGAVIAPPSTI